MPLVSIAAIIAWINIGQQVWERGSGLWLQIRAVLEQNGIVIAEKDNAAMDVAIADADTRRARARADAAGIS